MRIYSLSKVLSFPLVIAAGAILLTTFSGYRSEHSIWIMVPVILLVALYIFHGVIDFWWLERHPIPLDDKMRSWFMNNSPYFNSLNEEERIQFENRLSLYVEGREFKSVGTSELKDVPYDLKCIIASQGIRLTSNHSDYLIGDMDRIYLYKHPFPSPQHQFLHTAELHTEDGIMLMTTEYALPGIYNPKAHYNIALHTYAEAFVFVNPELNYPTVNHLGWKDLEKVMNFPKDIVLNTLGFENCNILAVHIVAYINFNEEYAKQFPQEHQQFHEIFG